MTSEKSRLTSGGDKQGFKYGDGGETDEFLSGLTGGKPKYRRPPPKRNDEVSVDTDTSSVPSNYYSPDYRAQREDLICGVEHCRSRAMMVVVSVILIGGGATLVAFLNHNMEYLKDLWPLAYFSMNVLGALYALSGIIGVAAAIADRDLWRRAALFVTVLACAGVIMGFVFATLVKSGQQDAKLLQDWVTMVRNDPGNACTVEHDLNCTGWTKACPYNASSASPKAAVFRGDDDDSAASDQLPSLIRALLREVSNSTQCLDDSLCALAEYHNVNQTCAAALQARVKQDYPAAIVALAFSVVWTILFTSLVVVRRERPTGYGSLQA